MPPTSNPEPIISAASASAAPTTPPIKLGKFSASKLIVKQSWAVLKQDKEIMWFPVISSITTLVAIVIMAALFFFIALGGDWSIFKEGGDAMANGYGQQGNPALEFARYLTLLVYYVVIFFIANFFQAGLLLIVQGRFSGQNLSFSDGIKGAQAHIGRIFMWSLISATVGVILRAIAERSRIIGAIVAGILGAAWNIMTYFSLPSLVIGNTSIKDSFKESAAIIRKTWGESIIINFGVGFFFGIIVFLLFALSIGIIVILQSFVVAIVVGILFVLAVIALSIVSSTLGSIFKLAIYNYARTGQIPSAFSPELVMGAVRAGKK